MPEDFFERKNIKEALKKAKELEQQPLPTNKEILETYQRGIQSSEDLKKLLKPSWFLRDDHPKRSRRKNL